MFLRRFHPIACAIALASTCACMSRPAAETRAAGDQNGDKELAALRTEVETLKDKAVSASVAMADVSFHWANLWFAAKAGNWPLATYYYNESRNHIRWLVRITPTPKGPDGNPVDLKSIFDAIDTSSLAAVKAAIDQKDAAKFPVVYKAMLESCYSCHKSVGRPYLRPQIPQSPPQTIVNMDPNASWPQ